jgi:hypothetical protein
VLAALSGCRASSDPGPGPSDALWEVAPGRVVVGPDGASTGEGGSGAPATGASHLGVCTKADQGNCCYDEKKGPAGIPKCSWTRLGTGESTLIVSAFRGKDKVTLPVQLELASATPEAFASYDDCLNAPVGFVLRGPGLRQAPLVGDIAHFDLKTSGTWVGLGGGGQVGLVAARSTTPDPSTDAGVPSPTYTLHDGLCAPLKDADVQASIQLFDQIDFTIDGVDYAANFNANPNGAAMVTGYYVQIRKAF